MDKETKPKIGNSEDVNSWGEYLGLTLLGAVFLSLSISILIAITRNAETGFFVLVISPIYILIMGITANKTRRWSKVFLASGIMSLIVILFAFYLKIFHGY